MFGLWFVNESIAHMINWSVLKDEYLYIISGLLLIVMAGVLLKYYRLDPIDQGLIINEQAINLTSQYTDEVRDQVTT